jgi:hypothetical protein
LLTCWTSMEILSSVLMKTSSAARGRIELTWG